MAIEVMSEVIEPGTPSTEMRRRWDDTIEKAKLIRNIKFVLLMPPNVQLVSQTLSTFFSEPGGGYVSIMIDEKFQWHIESKPTPIRERKSRRRFNNDGNRTARGQHYHDASGRSR
jgi:hypothetical protein